MGALFGLLAMTLACSLPGIAKKTPEPTWERPASTVVTAATRLPTQGEMPMRTPRALPLTATPAATGPGGGEIEVLDYTYSEDFSKTPANWTTSAFENDAGKAQFTVDKGVFAWDVTALRDMSLKKLADPAISIPKGDFLITVTIRFLEGPATTAAGILFHCQDLQNLYFARLGSDGSVSVHLLVDDRWQTLGVAKPGKHFLPRDPNRLIVQVHDGKYEVQLNDTAVVSFLDERLRGGTLGLAVEIDKGDHAVFTFDDVRIMAPAATAPVEGARPTLVPLGASYQYFDGAVGALTYSLEHPYLFVHSTDDGWDRFCLEAPEELCFKLKAHPGFEGDEADLADEIMSDFESTVSDYQELHSQHTQTDQGLTAYWVGYTFSRDGRPVEGSRLFVVKESVGFDIVAEGDPVMMDVYRAVVKKVLESFRAGS